jgi:hypothetical protein
MRSVPSAGRPFFPLDEELELAPGKLTPYLQEMSVRLASWMPFAHAAKTVTAFTQVPVSDETVRQVALRAGVVQVSQQEAAVQAMEAGALPAGEQGPEKLVIEADGAMVPLVGGQWQEVRTVAIGDVSAIQNHRGEWLIITHNLSYFSRLMDAQSFQRAALAETERRGLCQAKAVALVSDGAEWVQGFTDYHRPDAQRILDFGHASERFATIAEKCAQAGLDLGAEWAAQQRHRLKQKGGTAVLTTLRTLQKMFPEVDIAEPVAYLDKREKLLDYPQFQRDGWPIGSGAVESANKLVVEERLKGAGMHWHPENVNPMLALRNIICSDRWEETWPSIAQQMYRGPAKQDEALPPPPPRSNPVLDYYKQMQRVHRERQAQQPAAQATMPKKPWKPPANHPWRRDWRRP